MLLLIFLLNHSFTLITQIITHRIKSMYLYEYFIIPMCFGGKNLLIILAALVDVSRGGNIYLNAALDKGELVSCVRITFNCGELRPAGPGDRCTAVVSCDPREKRNNPFEISLSARRWSEFGLPRV